MGRKWTSNKGNIFIKSWRQVCIYVFPRELLLDFQNIRTKTNLERIEDIEVLRFLEMGYDVRMIEMSNDSIAVDVKEDINKVFSINIIGQIQLISMLQPIMSRKVRILMMSSISAQRGSFDPIYASSKAAISGFTKSMMSTLPKDATINAIAPGLIEESAMFDEMTNERQDFHKNQIHSGKLLLGSDLADIIFDLCQDHWSHLNGACIDLNGGQNVR